MASKAEDGPGEGVVLGLAPSKFDIVDLHPVPLEVDDADLDGFGAAMAFEDAELEEPKPRVVAKNDDLGFGDVFTSTSISSKVSPMSSVGGWAEDEIEYLSFTDPSG